MQEEDEDLKWRGETQLASEVAMITEKKKRWVHLSNVQIDMICGISAGIASNLISHPLDTLKVRMQLAEAKSI